MTTFPSVRSRPQVLWFDVGDLLWWLDHQNHVTGIQRTVFSVLCCLRDETHGIFPVRFCRFDWENGFSEVDDGTLDHYIRIVAENSRPPGEDVQLAVWDRTKQAIRKLLVTINGILPKAASPAYLALINWTAGWVRASIRLAGNLARGASRRGGNSGAIQDGMRACEFVRGDVLLNLGHSWINPGYPEGVRNIKEQFGITFVSMIYDLIPWLLPKFTRGSGRIFNPWIKSTVRLSDLLLAISEHTKFDLTNLMRQEFVIQQEYAAAARIEVVRLGDTPLPAPKSDATEIKTHLPFTERPYVLSVGTIEWRKNHRLLFNVWKQLLDEHGDSVPCMVWVGKAGWFPEGILQEVKDSNYLDGKLVILGFGKWQSVSEVELSYLYLNCLFTLFPSLYEGWGLPVAESLSCGKYCVASNASSIPEIAGNLIDYHAPDDVEECYRLVEKAIFDEDFRKGKEADIRARFKPQSWEECTKRILGTIRLTINEYQSDKTPQL